MSVLIKGMDMPCFPAFHEKDDRATFPAAIVMEKEKAPRLLVDYKIGYVDHDLHSYDLVDVPDVIDADALATTIKELVNTRGNSLITFDLLLELARKSQEVSEE